MFYRGEAMRRSPAQVLKKYEYVRLYYVIDFFQTGISLFVKITRNHNCNLSIPCECHGLGQGDLGVIYEVYKNKDYG